MSAICVSCSHEGHDNIRGIANQSTSSHQYRTGREGSNNDGGIGRMLFEKYVEETDGRSTLIDIRLINSDIVLRGGVCSEADVNSSIVQERREYARDEEKELKKGIYNQNRLVFRQPTFGPISKFIFVRTAIGADIVKRRPTKITSTSITGSILVE